MFYHQPPKKCPLCGFKYVGVDWCTLGDFGPRYRHVCGACFWKTKWDFPKEREEDL